MIIVYSIEDLKKELSLIKESIGFVPTMGYLHNGHISLIEKSVKENKKTVCSIFVNPTQFGENEDLEKYPKDIENDINMLKKANCDIVFIPKTSDIYKENKVFVDILGFSDCLCGKKRPGHFKGVLTIVCKLFNIVRPDRAYFGEKDYQQYIIIKKMVKDLNFDIDIRIGDIIREFDGLAMSSRNSYLNEEERKKAVFLYDLLCYAKKNAYMGQKRIELENKIEKYIIEKIDCNIITKDYANIRDGIDLELKEFISENSRLFLAFFVGKIRLIDNGRLL